MQVVGGSYLVSYLVPGLTGEQAVQDKYKLYIVGSFAEAVCLVATAENLW